MEKKNISFSKLVKAELVKCSYGCKECKRAQLYGMLLYSNINVEDRVILQTQQRNVANIIADYLYQLEKVKTNIVSTESLLCKGDVIYTVEIQNNNDLEKLCNKYNLLLADQIDYEFISQIYCLKSFLRGVFLACGVVTNPKTEYHLEFVVHSKKLSVSLCEALEQFDIMCKSSKRKNSYIVYSKESETVEDMLTLVGATKSAIEVMNVKIYKEIRNNANRTSNCETANITKTVNAATSQVNDIILIKDKIGFDNLSADLVEVANLRLDNPQASLRELCEITNGKLSRSGLHHRLKRLTDMAKELKV